jgi:hypothetical protein
MAPVARQVFAALLFIGILLAGLRLDLLRLPFSDLTLLQQELADAADRAAPDYPQFLEEVRRRTGPGEPIFIAASVTRSAYGPAYAYFRARYLMTDRTVLSAFDPEGRALAENLDRAQYVASWGTDFRDPRFRPIWSGHGGVLEKRAP